MDLASIRAVIVAALALTLSACGDGSSESLDPALEGSDTGAASASVSDSTSSSDVASDPTSDAASNAVSASAADPGAITPAPAASPIALTAFERFRSAEAVDAWIADLDAARLRGQRRRARRAEAGYGDGAGRGSGGLLNVQEAGVDEGGIVHRAGDFLVVLRRGRLYTVRVANDALAPVDRLDVPDRPTSPWSWYDEMVVAGSTVAVLGYSYGQHGTELRLFDLAPDGTLSRGPAYVLPSNDYYSSRNYATRRIGDELVLYTPLPFVKSRRGDDRDRFLVPSLRSLSSEDTEPLMEAGDVLRPVQHVGYPMLHAVIRCRLTERPLRCEARGIVGPRARSFYVSPNAVYLWVREPRWFRRQNENAPDAVVYRWPHDGSPPGAVRVFGAPPDQMSFAEREDALFVAVRAGGGGDAMWAPELSRGDLAMARIPLAALGGGIGDAPRDWYTDLPRPARMGFQNRFVGDSYVYGNGSGWFRPRTERTGFARVHRLGSNDAARVELGHSVDRVEALGDRALVIGTGGGDLVFSALTLGPGDPAVSGRFVQPDAAQGETRTHGFFFRDDGDGDGVLGLPIRGGRRGAWRHLFQSSAGVLYLDVRGAQLSRLGVLSASPGRTRDGCRVSCIDWYGNSRPLFWGDRVFALLGYELVEGSIASAGIGERRRVDLFAATSGER